MKNYSIIAILVLVLCGCRRQPGQELMRLYELTESAPSEALAALDSLDTGALGDADRHFAEFVRLKASDKAYITHTSDTAIVALLDYYGDDRRFGPEVLYYAGRVYSDLGDYPTALSYFQKALQASPVEKNPRLRGTISSQTGRLLNTLKLHTQAIPYLKETLAIDSLLSDTVNLMYDHQLLGAIYMRANELDSAEITLRKGMEWAHYLTDEETSLIDAYFAHIAYIQGDYEKALELIRGVPEKQPPISKNLPLLYAAQIYRVNGELDSAYHYVDALIHSKYYKNRCAGFEELFSTQLKELVTEDSVPKYLTAYNQLLDYAARNNSAENAIFQNTYFNYNNHYVKRIEAENRKNKTVRYVYGFAFLILILVMTLFFLAIRYQKKQIELLRALDDIMALNAMLRSSNRQCENLEREKQKLYKETTQEKNRNLAYGQTVVEHQQDKPPLDKDMFIDSDTRGRLKKELLQLSELTRRNDDNKRITESVIYQNLIDHLQRKESINYDSPVWKELEKMILVISPQFISKLQLILGSPLSRLELQTMMLIKCGLRNSDIAILTGRYPSAISQRRKSLCSKIFGDEIGIELFNNIIRNL